MMGIPPSEARTLTWREYQGLLWTWNDRHSPDDDDFEAPDKDFVARQMALIEKRGLARSVH